MTRLTPTDGSVVCEHCATPYVYDTNILTGEKLWMRRCKNVCRRRHPEQAPKFIKALDRSSVDEEGS